MKDNPRIIRVALAAMLLASLIGLVATGYSQNRRSQDNGQIWTVPSDTIISVEMTSTLTSRTAHVGDRFAASVKSPVVVNGVEVIPAGSIVEGRVSQVTPARRLNRAGALAVEFDDLVLPSGSRVPLVGNLTSDD